MEQLPMSESFVLACVVIGVVGILSLAVVSEWLRFRYGEIELEAKGRRKTTTPKKARTPKRPKPTDTDAKSSASKVNARKEDRGSDEQSLK